MLTFEWILLIAILVIAMIGGLATVRDAMLNELNDIAIVISVIDQTFTMQNSPDLDCDRHFGDVEGATFQDIRKGAGTPTPGD